MSDPELRLRLFIRRNGLPEVKLVWTVPCDTDFTVAKLLSQVNDVVPLESGEWGLEDYAVELKGADGIAFECLHFQQVSKVLKSDDQVVIRALLTDDIKRRRLSGRHQISSDGKHLVDGVAFGRPWLRAPRDRPGVPLPPRKRARLTYNDEDEDEYVNLDEDSLGNDEDSPLLLEYFGHDKEDYLKGQKGQGQAPIFVGGNQPRSVSFAATFDDADAVDPHDNDDEGADEDEEDDPDFDPGLGNADEEEGEDVDDAASHGQVDEDGDLSLELQDIRKDQSSPRGKEHEKRPGGFTKSFECDPEVQAKAKVLQTAFPDAPIGLCEQLIHDGNDLLECYHQVFKIFHPVLFPEEMLQHGRNSLKQLQGPEGKEGAIARFKNPQSTSGLETSSKESLTAHSAKQAPRSSSKNKGLASSSSSSSSSSSVSSDSSSDESESQPAAEAVSNSDSSSDVSSYSSDSSDSDVSDGDGTVIKHAQSAPESVTAVSDDGSSSSSSSSSSDDSDSDSEPEEASSKAPVSQNRLAAGPQPQPPTATHDSRDDQQPTPPGQGLRKTQRRNLRRKLAKRKATEAPDESSQADRLAPPSAATPSSHQNDDLLARKKALLELMETDYPEDSQKQVETRQSSSALANHEEQEAVPGPSTNSPDRTTTEPLPPASEDTAGRQNLPNVAEAEQQGLDTASKTAPEQRRTKLNLGAGRRMLFGALGLRNPKSKADEDKLRTDLMKNVRPHTNPRAAEAESTQPQRDEEPEASAEDEDPDAWREKINYRAVECCEENVDLSEPPFPFVQRWDPQQQAEGWFGSNKSGGKRKRAQRNAAQYYQDQEEDPQTSKKQRFADDSAGLEASWAPEDDSNLDDTVLTYDDPPTKPTTADSQFSDMDDLPMVPSDLSPLPIMRTGEAKPGMVITWKQLLLSTATNWQPQLVNLTAIVVNIEETRLRLLLAKRDRELDRNEKVYDETTGKRIYDRFEAPDMDEDEDEEEAPDDGYRDLDFSELMEPRVLQQPLRTYGPALALQDSDVSGHSVVHETPLASQGPAEADSEIVHNASSQTIKPSKAKRQDSDETMDADGGSSRQRPGSASASSAVANAAASAEIKQQTESSVGGNEEMSGISRQLEGMSEHLEVSGEDHSAEPTPAPFETNDVDLPSFGGDQLDDAQHGGNVAALTEAPSQGLQSSVDSSVRSGRQPDPDFSIDLGQGSPIPMEEEEGSGALDDATPKAGKPVETPKKPRPVDEPQSGSSLPSINEIWATAATSRSAREPSSAALEAAFQSQTTSVGPDAAYEEAMRRLDDASDVDDEAFADTTKKQLFPNATQPAAKLSASSPADKKPDLNTVKSEERKTSGFSIPTGSQVVALSSDSSSSAGEERFEENYAYDDVDGDYQDLNSPSKGGEGTQRKTRQNATGKEKGTDKAKPKGKAKGKAKALPESLPIKNRVKGGFRRASMPASSQLGKVKGKKSARGGRRVTSINGEI